MRELDHRRQIGYLAAYKQIALNAAKPEPIPPEPLPSWWTVLQSWGMKLRLVRTA